MAGPLTVHRVERTASTQDLAHQAGEAGAPHGSVFVAAEQTGGRGSRGRSWHAPAGGLWLSALVRPAAAAVGLLSLRAGIAVAEGLGQMPSLPRVLLKWPNDLIVDGRKVGGLLVETRWRGDVVEWAVIGVGINVHNDVPDGVVPPAGRLDDDQTVTLGAVEAIVTGAVVAAAAAPGGRLSDGELRRFADRDWLQGRAITTPVCGRCDGIDAEGRLLVVAPGGDRLALRDPIAWPDLADPGVPT